MRLRPQAQGRGVGERGERSMAIARICSLTCDDGVHLGVGPLESDFGGQWIWSCTFSFEEHGPEAQCALAG
jgi:hypothetical protein